MAGYIGTVPAPQATQLRQTFTATASQTTFGTAGYTVGYIDVFMNGVKLVDGTDYTATNASEVVLTTGAAAAAGDIFRVHEQELNKDVTIDATENALCAGPLTVASGITLTVTTGGNLSIV